LGGDGVGLVGRVSGVKIAVLENYSGVSEYEVDGSVDVAFTVKLSLRVNIKGVLVALEAALVEDGEVGARDECHRLMVFGPGGVPECHGLGYELVSGHSCEGN